MITHQEVFTSPGTWTCPPITTSVKVFIVGGGGGGTAYGTPVQRGYGGGGGCREEVVPVSGPVPVVVGAGGTSTNTPFTATVGGTTSFGPFSVDGGGAARGPASSNNAPANGGGGASISPPLRNGQGGLYGYPGQVNQAGGQIYSRGDYYAGNSRFPGYGGGGSGANVPFDGGAAAYDPTYPNHHLNAARANSGGGGAMDVYPGAAGVVIVEWYE